MGVASFIVLTGASYFFVDPVIAWLAKPVGGFIFTGPTDALFMRIKIAAGLGLVLAMPVFLYQGWRFVEVALVERERSWIGRLLPASYGLFLLGVSLALFGVLPLAVRFLLDFQSPFLQPLISIQAYVSFLVWMTVGFGILFQLPLVVLFLCAAGVVEPETLARYRKHVVIGVLVTAAFLTPGPDVVSQLILTVPSYLLFEISLFLARRGQRRRDG